MECKAYEEKCGNGKVDINFGEYCDNSAAISNEQKAINIKTACSNIFGGEDHYQFIQGNVTDSICNDRCNLNVNSVCVYTSKFTGECTSSDNTPVMFSSNFDSGSLDGNFYEVEGDSNTKWEISGGVLKHNGTENSKLMYNKRISADNYTIEMDVKWSDVNKYLDVILNKDSSGINYYKVRINPKSSNDSGLYFGEDKVFNLSGTPDNIKVNDWYKLTIKFNTDGAGTSARINATLKKYTSGKRKVQDTPVVSVDDKVVSKISSGFFAIGTEGNNIEVDSLNIRTEDDLYIYTNESYNFGFYYCKQQGDLGNLTVQDDSINSNDAECPSGLKKCMDRSCRIVCNRNACSNANNASTQCTGSNIGDCCGQGKQCDSNGECKDAFYDYGGYSGAYVLENNNESHKVFLDDNNKPVMVMRVWSVPRAEGDNNDGLFVTFKEWVARMTEIEHSTFLPYKRENFEDDYYIFQNNTGTTYYFWAPNISGSNGYINVYVLSYHEGGDLDLFRQIIQNIRFNTNLE